MNFERKQKLLAPLTFLENLDFKRVIVILENCPLEVGKVGNMYRLLSVDEHKNFLSKYKPNPDFYRPDIVHQCLLMLLDSPLNKAGKLEVIVSTHKKVLIKVNSKTRIPRTYKRFAGLMVQLLFHLKVAAVDAHATLLKLVKKPVTNHIPVGCLKIALSRISGECISLNKYIPKLLVELREKKKAVQKNVIVKKKHLVKEEDFEKFLKEEMEKMKKEKENEKNKKKNEEIEEENDENHPKKKFKIEKIFSKNENENKIKNENEIQKDEDENKKENEDNNELEQIESDQEKEEEEENEEIAKESICFIVGGFSHGSLDVDYADKTIAISKYPLSAAICCSKICNAFEEYWNIC